MQEKIDMEFIKDKKYKKYELIMVFSFQLLQEKQKKEY